MSKTEFSAEEIQELEAKRLWPRFLLFPTLAMLGYIGFVMGLGGDSFEVKLAWAVGVGYCWFCVAGLFHESVHQTLGKHRTANIWAGKMVGILLGIPYSAYRETHIRHHAYMNTPRDWELWPYSSPECSRRFRQIFAWFDLLGGVVSAPYIYTRIYFKKNSSLNEQARREIRREFQIILLFWAGILGTVGILVANGTLDASKFEWNWLLPLPIAAGFNTIRKFTEHLGMASTDPILGTRTVIGSGLITRLCSYFNFELFVHGPHHRFPKSPHHQLASKLRTFQQQNPDKFVPLFSTYLAAVWDMLPSLLKNPGTGEVVGGTTKYCLKDGVENFVSVVELTSSHEPIHQEDHSRRAA